MYAVVDVVIPILIHCVDHGDRRCALLVKVAQTSARHDGLQDIHVEAPRDGSLLEKFLHLAVNIAVVLGVFIVELCVPLGSHSLLRRLCLRRFFLLHGREDTILIDIDGCDPLLLEQVDRRAIQNCAALNQNDLRLAFVDRTPNEHFRQEAPNSKRF